MIPDHPDTPLQPTHYRGSLAIAAENYLARYLDGPSPHGHRREQCWRNGYLIHRCTDVKTGHWVEVTPGERYMPHKLWAQGRRREDGCAGEAEPPQIENPEVSQ